MAAATLVGAGVALALAAGTNVARADGSLFSNAKHSNNTYRATMFFQPTSDLENENPEGMVNFWGNQQFSYLSGEGRSRFEDLFLRHAIYNGNDGRKYLKFDEFKMIFVHPRAQRNARINGQVEFIESTDRFLHTLFRLADADEDGMISFTDFLELAENLQSPDCVARFLWKQLDGDNDGLISPEKWTPPCIEGEFPLTEKDLFPVPRSYTYEEFLQFIRQRQDQAATDKYNELKDVRFGISSVTFYSWLLKEVQCIKNDNIRHRIIEMAYNENPHGVTLRPFIAWHRLIHNIDGVSLSLDQFIGFQKNGHGPFRYRRNLPTIFRLINNDLAHTVSREQLLLAMNHSCFQRFKWIDMEPLMQILDFKRDGRIDLREILSYKKALHNDPWYPNYADPINMWYQGLAASFLSVPFVFTVLRFAELDIPFRQFNLENFKLAFFGGGWGRFINTAYAHCWHTPRHLMGLYFGHRMFLKQRTEDVASNLVAGVVGGLTATIIANPCENRIIHEELTAKLKHTWNPGRWWTFKHLGFSKYLEGCLFGTGISMLPLACVFFPVYAQLRAGLESPEGSMSWQRCLAAGTAAGYLGGYTSNLFMTWGEKWQQAYRSTTFNEWSKTGSGGRSFEADFWNVWDKYFRQRWHRRFFHIGRIGGYGGFSAHARGLQWAIPMGFASMYIDYNFWGDHDTQLGPTCQDNYSSKHRNAHNRWGFSKFRAMEFFEPIRLQAQVRRQEMEYLVRCLTKQRLDGMTSFLNTKNDKSSFASQ